MKPLDVLVVEDNPGDQILIRRAFKELGQEARISVVENGVDAIGYLRREGSHAAAPPPMLVILDLNLARKDGREVLSEVKTDPKLKLIPIVVFSTSNARSDIEESYRLGANAFLTKPSDLADFIDSVQSIGRFWLQKAQLARV